MYKYLLITFMSAFIINNAFAAGFSKLNLSTDNWHKLAILPVDYQNQDEAETKNEKDPPRVVSFEEEFRKLKKPEWNDLFKIFLTGLGENVDFKSKVDKRFFKMFKRYLAVHDIDVAKKPVEFRGGLDTHRIASIYFSYIKEGYGKKTRAAILNAQRYFAQLLNFSEFYLERLKKPKNRSEELEAQRLKRKIGYAKGMLKELGRLIEHLDKQKQ